MNKERVEEIRKLIFHSESTGGIRQLGQEACEIALRALDENQRLKEIKTQEIVNVQAGRFAKALEHNQRLESRVESMHDTISKHLKPALVKNKDWNAALLELENALTSGADFETENKRLRDKMKVVAASLRQIADAEDGPDEYGFGGQLRSLAEELDQ